MGDPHDLQHEPYVPEIPASPASPSSPDRPEVTELMNAARLLSATTPPTPIASQVCPRCRNMRHVPVATGGYERCPECFGPATVLQELQVRALPRVWALLKPELVIERFGVHSVVGQTIAGLHAGRMQRVHAHGFMTDARMGFTGALAYGFLATGRGINVLDTGSLAASHFDKAENRSKNLSKSNEPMILALGGEVEPRIGLFYFREFLNRSVEFGIPFVMITDYPIAVHAPRYNNLLELMRAATFDAVDVPINGGSV